MSSVPRPSPQPSPLEGRGDISPAWRWLGIGLVEVGEGSATVEMTPSEDMANHAGFVHGGMISALADSAMGRSLRTLVPGVARAMSFDLKLSFISPARVGETLRATGRVVHAGRRTAVGECRVETLERRLVATASGTFAITREKGITEGSNAD
ncbi:MAG: PaaI family thioesterase [Chloroflexi bacterium]|nr:MAG: PaaI family thioesterase [Chloroflexota bacterium]